MSGAARQPVIAVIPALDEARCIAATVGALIGQVDQVIVVDAASRDATRANAQKAGACVLDAPRGRARQMNAGARHALLRYADGPGALEPAPILWFVHADTEVPPDAAAQIRQQVGRGARWGRFDVRFDDPQPLLSMVAWFMNRRSRLSAICTGDQAIYVTASLWRELGGYADIVLMEDVELSARAKRLARPAAHSTRVTTSARRWQRDGVLRTIGRMWWLRALYFLGRSPERLLAAYERRRG